MFPALLWFCCSFELEAAGRRLRGTLVLLFGGEGGMCRLQGLCISFGFSVVVVILVVVAAAVGPSD